MPETITPNQARARFGAQLEEFGRVLGAEARRLDIQGFACILMTDQGVNVLSGGTHEDWRPTMRRIAGRVADELGQVLIAAGIGQKPDRKRGQPS